MTLMAPIALHATQLAALDATAADMTRANPAVPRVSRSWALREVLTWGCAELDALLSSCAPITLAAPSPTRGAPRRAEGGSAAANPEFRTVAPQLVPLPLARHLRGLRAKLARATGARVTLAMTLREALLHGHAARERARVEAEKKTREQLEFLRLAGFPDPSKMVVVAARVVVPYSPPGPKSSAPWSNKWTPPSPQTPEKPEKPAPLPAKKARARGATSRPQTTARTRSAPVAKRRRAGPTTEGGDDDDPAPPVSRSAGSDGGGAR